MNKYTWIVAAAIFACLTFSATFGLRYSQATVLFGLVAVISAPIFIHKVSDKNWSIGGVVILAFFASFPLKKLLQVHDTVHELTITLFYFVVLWIISFGWKRSYQ